MARAVGRGEHSVVAVVTGEADPLGGEETVDGEGPAGRAHQHGPAEPAAPDAVDAASFVVHHSHAVTVVDVGGPGDAQLDVELRVCEAEVIGHALLHDGVHVGDALDDPERGHSRAL